MSPGLATMLCQKRQRGGEKTRGGRVTDIFNEKNSPSGSTPPHSPDLCPPINIPYTVSGRHQKAMGGSPFYIPGRLAFSKVRDVCLN